MVGWLVDYCMDFTFGQGEANMYHSSITNNQELTIKGTSWVHTQFFAHRAVCSSVRLSSFCKRLLFPSVGIPRDVVRLSLHIHHTCTTAQSIRITWGTSYCCASCCLSRVCGAGATRSFVYCTGVFSLAFTTVHPNPPAGSFFCSASLTSLLLLYFFFLESSKKPLNIYFHLCRNIIGKLLKKQATSATTGLRDQANVQE